MVLGSPLLHALSGLARARLGWLCPRAWGGELVVRVSDRLVRRAVGCLHGSGSVRGRGVLTGGCFAAGRTTASMAPKPRTQFRQDKKARPGEGKSQPNRVTVNLPVMLVEALQRMYKTEDVTSSSGGAGRAAEQSAMPGVQLHSVWHAQSVKEKCKGYQGCLQRGCFDLNCPRGNRCPLSQTQRRKAAQNQGA